MKVPSKMWPISTGLTIVVKVKRRTVVTTFRLTVQPKLNFIRFVIFSSCIEIAQTFRITSLSFWLFVAHWRKQNNKLRTRCGVGSPFNKSSSRRGNIDYTEGKRGDNAMLGGSPTNGAGVLPNKKTTARGSPLGGARSKKCAKRWKREGP